MPPRSICWHAGVPWRVHVLNSSFLGCNWIGLIGMISVSVPMETKAYCSGCNLPTRVCCPLRGKTMPNRPVTRPPQPTTKGTPDRPEWKVPTLADLLQRLSVTSAKSVKASTGLGAGTVLGHPSTMAASSQGCSLRLSLLSRGFCVLGARV